MSKTKIALVDDHSLLRNSLANLITSFDGYEVLFEADNGKHFIEQLPLHPSSPDIIMLDITMPEMNGYETAVWIKQNLPATKVLILSMMDNDAAIISMLKAGARGYLLKDSKPVVLKQALDDIRDKGFYMNDLVNNKMLNYVMGDEQKKDTDIISQLTPKEIIFLKLACTEMSYKQIADQMGLSSRTVEGYRDDLFKKLNVISRVGLVVFAIKNGLYKI
jgi:DNA-binding NarL/FixJ family response regulator